MCQCYRITEWFRLRGTIQFQSLSHWQGHFLGDAFLLGLLLISSSWFWVHFSSDVCAFVPCHCSPQLAESPLLPAKSLLPVLPPASGSYGRWVLKIKGPGGLQVRLYGSTHSPPVAV